MDRNNDTTQKKKSTRVALRKESVDRNMLLETRNFITLSSLSERRAWIEILPQQRVEQSRGVALRKESVDRNLGYTAKMIVSQVALRKESVDRNLH